MLPSFLIIGAQRAGTTSLFRYLQEHPEVAWPRATKREAAWSKEIHFFDDRYWRGVAWYRGFFPLEATQRVARVFGRNLLACEASPSYLFHPAVPERVKETLPDGKFIAILRNPVDRAYSHHRLMMRSKREHLSFEDALAAEEERLTEERPRVDVNKPKHRSDRYRHHAYVAKGLYVEQLERWLEHFPREQLLVLSTEEFAEDPEGTYGTVLSFFGLKPHKQAEFPLYNRLPAQPMNPETRARLEERFAEPNERLARLLGRDFGWNAARTATTSETASG